MEYFIKEKTDKLFTYKRNIFTMKQATNFIRKQTQTEDYKKIDSELRKSLLPPTIIDENMIKERLAFIDKFINELKELRKKNPENKKEEKEWRPQLVHLDDENQFPSLKNNELIKRKKNFVLLDRHFENKLEKGIKPCFCMSSKHPLVINCLECGRVHCLQEGDKVCINCGAQLVKREVYKEQMINDNILKIAYNNKEKLLSFQKEFYSKLKIIDDYNDWYEVSKNTWLDDESRAIAKKNDEESQITEKLV